MDQNKVQQDGLPADTEKKPRYLPEFQASSEELLALVKGVAVPLVKKLAPTIKTLKAERKALDAALVLKAQSDQTWAMIDAVQKDFYTLDPAIKKLWDEKEALRDMLFGDGRYVGGVLMPREPKTSARAKRYDELEAQLKDIQERALAPLYERADALKAEAQASGAIQLWHDFKNEQLARRAEQS